MPSTRFVVRSSRSASDELRAIGNSASAASRIAAAMDSSSPCGDEEREIGFDLSSAEVEHRASARQMSERTP